MKKILFNCFILVSYCLFTCQIMEATPSSIFWTNCTTSVYDTDLLHIDIDNYGSVANRRGHGEYFPPSVGITYGFFTWKQLKTEIGCDFYLGADDPLYFNAKIGVVDENVLFSHAPSISVGVFNVGTRRHGLNKTNQDVLDIIVGKTLPNGIGGGNINIGGFAGNHAMGKNRFGFMVAYANSFIETVDCEGNTYSKYAVNIDYASGKNTIGGLGACLYYYFTKDIYVQTGPVFFNDASINGSWKYSVQLNYDFPNASKCKCE